MAGLDFLIKLIAVLGSLCILYVFVQEYWYMNKNLLKESKETSEVKNELLDYVKQIQTSNEVPTSNEDLTTPEPGVLDSGVKEGNFYSDFHGSDLADEHTNLSTFFDNTDSSNREYQVKADVGAALGCRPGDQTNPDFLSSQLEGPLYQQTSNLADKAITWEYPQENVMNGGKMNGVTGY